MKFIRHLQPRTFPKGAIIFSPSFPNYTERPDLLIAEIERHDPGFVKRMNERSQEISEETRKARFKFSKVQAYATLSIQIIAALVILFLAYTAVSNGGARDFWTIVALVLFYAVSQGGKNGFLAIIKGAIGIFKGGNAPDSPKQ